MVATEAVLDPEAAASTAPASTQAIASPPRTRRSSRLHAIIRSREMPPQPSISAISTNIGIVSST